MYAYHICTFLAYTQGRTYAYCHKFSKMPRTGTKWFKRALQTSIFFKLMSIFWRKKSIPYFLYLAGITPVPMEYDFNEDHLRILELPQKSIFQVNENQMRAILQFFGPLKRTFAMLSYFIFSSKSEFSQKPLLLEYFPCHLFMHPTSDPFGTENSIQVWPPI